MRECKFSSHYLEKNLRIKNNSITFAPVNERRCIDMLIIPVKEGENIDRALKRYKRKFDRIGIVRELRSRQHFTKKSVIKRGVLQRAQFIQRLRDLEEI